LWQAASATKAQMIGAERMVRGASASHVERLVEDR
jgi:hypothetical protein